MTTKIGTNVVDLSFIHIFFNFFRRSDVARLLTLTVTQPHDSTGGGLFLHSTHIIQASLAPTNRKAML